METCLLSLSPIYQTRFQGPTCPLRILDDVKGDHIAANPALSLYLLLPRPSDPICPVKLCCLQSVASYSSNPTLIYSTLKLKDRPLRYSNSPVLEQSSCPSSLVFVATRHIACSYSCSGAQLADTENEKKDGCVQLLSGMHILDNM